MFGQKSSQSGDTSPTTEPICREWDAQLRRFGQGESVDLASLTPLPESADKSDVQGLARSSFQAVDQRFQRIDERFRQSVSDANDWRVYERAVVHLRSELRQLHHFISTAPLPEQLATALMGEFRAAVQKLQDDLDTGAQHQARTTGDHSLRVATRTRLGQFEDPFGASNACPSEPVPRSIRLERING